MEYNQNGILFITSCESVSSPIGFGKKIINSMKHPAEFHGNK